MTKALMKSIRQSIGTGKQRFETIVDKAGSELNWGAETLFAMQVIEKSKYLQGCTLSSLKGSVINIASIGLTLNPAEKLAYLIPRKRNYKEDGKWVSVWEACLDISYRGLIKIATDSGSIRWAKAMLVLNGEEFTWKGVDEKPVHNITNPFNREENDPDKLIGGYSLAKTSDGDYLCEMMTAKDILAIRDRSEAWIRGDKGKKGPWESDHGQMAKKTLLRRGSVSWPISERFTHAEGLLNVHQGIDFNDADAGADEAQELLVDDTIVGQLEKLVKGSHVDIKRIYKAFNIEALKDLPMSKLDDCKQRLAESLAAYKAKEKKDATT